jgi:hypothetical protein
MAVTDNLPDFVRDSPAKGLSRQAFMYVVAVVTVSVVAGLLLVGHPPEARSRETGSSEPVGDLIAGRLYPYQVVGIDTYELCRRLSTQFRRF